MPEIWRPSKVFKAALPVITLDTTPFDNAKRLEAVALDKCSCHVALTPYAVANTGLTARRLIPIQ